MYNCVILFFNMLCLRVWIWVRIYAYACLEFSRFFLCFIILLCFYHIKALSFRGFQHAFNVESFRHIIVVTSKRIL